MTTSANLQQTDNFQRHQSVVTDPVSSLRSIGSMGIDRGSTVRTKHLIAGAAIAGGLGATFLGQAPE